MNIRTAVAITLAVFLLSVGTIIAMGLSQPLPAQPTVSSGMPLAAPPADIAQVRRDFLASAPYEPSVAPSQPSAQPSQDAVAQQGAQTDNQATVQQNQQPAPPQAAPAPQPPPQPTYVAPQPTYYYTTRAS